MGFNAEWGVLSAAGVGAPHMRERIWIVAQRRDIFSHPNDHGARWWQQFETGTKKAESGIDANAHGLRELQPQGGKCNERGLADKSVRRNEWWGAEPGVGRMVHGVANRVDRIKALGNGQVPAVAAKAWYLLLKT